LSDILVTATGIVGTPPRHATLPSGASVASFRLASTRRRLVDDRWVDGPTTWVTVTCWRQLADNVMGSVEKGQRVVVQGRLLVRRWKTEDGRSGVNVEIEAAGLGSDLVFGTSVFTRASRSAYGEVSVPPEQAALVAEVSSDGEEAEGYLPDPRPEGVDSDGVIDDDYHDVADDTSPSAAPDRFGSSGAGGHLDEGAPTQIIPNQAGAGEIDPMTGEGPARPEPELVGARGRRK